MAQAKKSVKKTAVRSRAKVTKSTPTRARKAAQKSPIKKTASSKAPVKTAIKKAPAAEVAKQPVGISKKIKDLLNFNKLMFVLHAVQGVVVLAISGSAQRTVTTNTLVAENPNASDESFRLISQTKDLFGLELAPLVALFFFLSAAAHFYVSFVARDNYIADLKKGMNKARWYEYAASASLMLVLIALLSGIYDIGSLLGIFALSAVMNMMGLIMEIVNQGKKKISWLAYNIGCFAGIVPWLVIAITLWATQSEAAAGQGIPTFVLWIFVSLFVFFNAFAINMVLQYKGIGKWSDYLYGEKAYMILSLLAKSALAWQVYGGTLQPV